MGVAGRLRALDRRVLGPVRSPDQLSTARLAWTAGGAGGLWLVHLVVALRTGAVLVPSGWVLAVIAVQQSVPLLGRVTPTWSSPQRRAVLAVGAGLVVALAAGATAAEHRTAAAADAAEAAEQRRCDALQARLLGQVPTQQLLDEINSCGRGAVRR